VSLSRVDYPKDLLVKGRLYNLTVYRDCCFKCAYCWARLPFFSTRVKKGKYDPVEKARKIPPCNTVLISFTSDPYQGREKEERKTRAVLEVLIKERDYDYDGRILVLTKNPMLAWLLDRDLYGWGTWIGSTLISAHTDRRIEPFAPSVEERLEALKLFSDADVDIFVSIEPIIPHVSDDIGYLLSQLAELDTLRCVIFGALNYYKQLKLPWKFTKKQLQKYYLANVPNWLYLCKELGIDFYVKKELREYFFTVEV